MMTSSTSSAMVYAICLQKIVDSHFRKTWDRERTDFEQEED